MAKSIERLSKDYEEYTNFKGETLLIHAVPQQVIRSIKPQRPKPRRPEVEMKTKVGTQKRWIKEGDEGWDEYQEKLQEWEDEQDQLQEAVTLCLALRSVTIPDPIIFAPHIQLLIDTGVLEDPKDQWLRKVMWLRSEVIGQHDEYMISLIIQKLSGVPEDMIEEMKSNFRDLLLGKRSKTVGIDSNGRSRESEEIGEDESVL